MKRTSKGFTLYEMITALGLLAVFTAMAGQLFHSTASTTRWAGETLNAAAQFEDLCKTLRRDAWSSADMQADGGSKLTLRTPGGLAIEWKRTDDGVTRTAGDDIRHWEAPADLAFSADPSSAIITWKDRFTHELYLPRQLRIAGGAQ